jgi:hypothetical protein
MSNTKTIIIFLFVPALGWSIFYWGTSTHQLQQQYSQSNTAVIPASINYGQPQVLAQQATNSNGDTPSFPRRQLTFYLGNGEIGVPADSDFKFSYFYLGATQAAVTKACQLAGGQIAGIWLDSIANPPGFPVCYFQSDMYTDGYYPVYWPAK